MKKIMLANSIIEIDEVEYLVNAQAATDIEENKNFIQLMRLIDGQVTIAKIQTIRDAINVAGVIDIIDSGGNSEDRKV